VASANWGVVCPTATPGLAGSIREGSAGAVEPDTSWGAPGALVASRQRSTAATRMEARAMPVVRRLRRKTGAGCRRPLRGLSVISFMGRCSSGACRDNDSSAMVWGRRDPAVQPKGSRWQVRCRPLSRHSGNLTQWRLCPIVRELAWLDKSGIVCCSKVKHVDLA